MGKSKRCAKCRQVKVLAMFHRNKQLSHGRHSFCKACRSITVAGRMYGIRHEQITQMILDQDGKCAICLDGPTGNRSRLTVDHDHKTGIVRELLCNHCNVGLGAFKDSIELLNVAIRYLKKHEIRAT